MKRLKADTQSRSVTEVGPGDYVKIMRHWERIKTNTAYGEQTTPRHWTIETEGGVFFDMYDINAYAKAEDFQ